MLKLTVILTIVPSLDSIVVSTVCYTTLGMLLEPV